MQMHTLVYGGLLPLDVILNFKWFWYGEAFKIVEKAIYPTEIAPSK